MTANDDQPAPGSTPRSAPRRVPRSLARSVAARRAIASRNPRVKTGQRWKVTHVAHPDMFKTLLVESVDDQAGTCRVFVEESAGYTESKVGERAVIPCRRLLALGVYLDSARSA